MMSVVLGCVSKYPPLKPVQPLSGNCEDYADFSLAILKQRDQGFTKRAATSIAGFAVNGESKRRYLYQLYKPVIEIVFADYQVKDKGIHAAGKILCEHKLTESWPLLINQQYSDAAKIVVSCQNSNYSEVDIENCLLTMIKGGYNLDLPPE